MNLQQIAVCEKTRYFEASFLGEESAENAQRPPAASERRSAARRKVVHFRAFRLSHSCAELKISRTGSQVTSKLIAPLIRLISARVWQHFQVQNAFPDVEELPVFRPFEGWFQSLRQGFPSPVQDLLPTAGELLRRSLKAARQKDAS